jgi:hypothetical protein
MLWGGQGHAVELEEIVGRQRESFSENAFEGSKKLWLRLLRQFPLILHHNLPLHIPLSLFAILKI